MITSATYCTLSIAAAHAASAKNRHLGPVTLAKCNEGTAVVIEARYPGRLERTLRYGYLRFGSLKPVWVDGLSLPHSSAMNRPALGHPESTLDQVICRETVEAAMKAANESEQCFLHLASE